MHTVSNGDSMHEMPNLFSEKKNKKNISYNMSAENFTQHAKR